MTPDLSWCLPGARIDVTHELVYRRPRLSLLNASTAASAELVRDIAPASLVDVLVLTRATLTIVVNGQGFMLL